MEAASPLGTDATPGTCRLLEHCVTLALLTNERRTSARARLESQLGDDLADLLVGTLVRDRQEPKPGTEAATGA